MGVSDAEGDGADATGAAGAGAAEVGSDCSPAGGGAGGGAGEELGRAAPQVPGEVGGTPRRKQAEWVDVRVLADPNAEMDVRNRVLCIARRPGIRDRVSLGDDGALPDAHGSQMRERRLVSVAGDDRDREPVGRNLPGERHLAGCGARTEALSPTAMSIPRCWPAAYLSPPTA